MDGIIAGAPQRRYSHGFVLVHEEFEERYLRDTSFLLQKGLPSQSQPIRMPLQQAIFTIAELGCAAVEWTYVARRSRISSWEGEEGSDAESGAR